MSDRDRNVLIASHLASARAMLHESALSGGALRGESFSLDRNELNLEINRLESYAQQEPVPREFWMALRDAAIGLGHAGRAAYFEHRAELSTPTDVPETSVRSTASDFQYRPEKDPQAEWRLMKDIAFGLGVPVIVIASIVLVDVVMAELPRTFRIALMIAMCVAAASLLYRSLRRMRQRRTRLAHR